MRKAIVGQMMLELFPDEAPRCRDVFTPDWCLEWLEGWPFNCTEAVRPYIEGLWAEFDPPEAFERAKCFKSLDGRLSIDGWEPQDAIDVYDVYNHEIDYHVCWDRAWAARQGFSKDEVRRMAGWDYGKRAPVWD